MLYPPSNSLHLYLFQNLNAIKKHKTQQKKIFSAKIAKNDLWQTTFGKSERMVLIIIHNKYAKATIALKNQNVMV